VKMILQPLRLCPQSNQDELQIEFEDDACCVVDYSREDDLTGATLVS